MCAGDATVARPGLLLVTTISTPPVVVTAWFTVTARFAVPPTLTVTGSGYRVIDGATTLKVFTLESR